MNLVQINERLKDLPMQVIQQYANGMNPEVPPYLALGELQRREIAQKQMANQGGATGQQPSIKDQVEQKAGLMELQQMQQQQMAQQQMQPRGPMPAPAGVSQPEPQSEVMMARGGLAAVPMRRDMFEYAGGGIIAFAGGGDVDAARQQAKDALAKLRTYGLRQRQQDPEGYRAAEEAAAAAQAKRSAVEASYAEEMQASGVNRPATSMQDVGAVREAMSQSAPTVAPFKQPSVSEAQATMQAGSQAAVPPLSGLKAAADEIKTPTPPAAAQPPSAQPTGLPGALNQAAVKSPVNPYMAQLEALVNKEPVKPTEEATLESIKKLTPEAMQDEAMKKRFADQRGRLDQERSAYDKSRPSGLDDLIRMLGQAGQYKGLSGMAPAYTAIQQQRRAEDLAMEERQNKLMTAIEGREYDGAKEKFGANTKAFDVAQQLFGKQASDRIKGISDLAQVTQTQINNELKLMTDRELKMLDLASRAADRKVQGAGDARKSEYVALKAQARALKAAGKPEAAAEADAKAADILASGGGAGTAGVGGVRNQIMERRQTMVGLEKIMKDEGVLYSDAEKAEAAKQYRSLAMQNAKDETGGDNGGQIDTSNPLLKK